MTIAGPSRITRLIVDKLFGYYDYVLPDRDHEEKDVSSFFILYGDNGSGKTTILNLIFSLLLSRQRLGAKTFIANTPFQRFIIEFDDGTRVSALRASQRLVGSFVIKIDRPGLAPFEFPVPTNESGKVSIKIAQMETLFRKVNELKIALFFLPDVDVVKQRMATFSAAQLEYRNTVHKDDLREVVCWLAREKGVPQQLRRPDVFERVLLSQFATIDLLGFELFDRIYRWASRAP